MVYRYMQGRRCAVGVTAMLAFAGTVVLGVATPASAAPVAGSRTHRLLDRADVPAGIAQAPRSAGRAIRYQHTVSGTVAARPKSASNSKERVPYLKCADCDDPGGPPGGPGPSYYCTASVSYGIGAVGYDDFLEDTVRVDYSASVWCNYLPDSINGSAGVIDRSAPSYRGENFDGRTLGTGSTIATVGGSSASSSGSLTVLARDYDGGRAVEPMIDLYIADPSWMTWAGCYDIPGLRYLACDGLGTSYLHVALGVGAQGTGLAVACRDQSTALDTELSRVTDTAPSTGTVPASTRLLERLPALRDEVVEFKRALCGITDPASAPGWAAARGRDLWDSAVAHAQANLAAEDDRPLYWARASMLRVLHQWRSAGGFDAASTLTTFEDNSRGMTSDAFGGSTAKRVFVSGFDPFGLDDDRSSGSLLRGNPSGAAVLRLDGAVVNGAEVQAVIAPVRFADFDAGLVERVFAPHLRPGPQQATLITTVSQGRSGFDLEAWNGRNRSDRYADNQGGYGGVAQTGSPAPAPNLGGGAQFVPSTLPLDQMLGTGPYGVIKHTDVTEILPDGTVHPGPNGPTPGSTAISGGGGGWLSNEIAYRVTRLRDELGVGVPAGHVHVPSIGLSLDPTDSAVDGQRLQIVQQYEAVLGQAVAAS